MGEDEIESIRRVAELGLKSTLMTWNRLNTNDIDASLKTGVKNLHISVPASFIQIEKKLGTTPEELLRETDRIIRYAMKKGCNI